MSNTPNSPLQPSPFATQLFAKFSQGISWNGISYITYKALFTTLSFLLFTRLTTQDFSLFANINSIIFLTLLWLDCGFRKSVPLFFPQFSSTPHTHQRFIRYIILWQSTTLLLAIPLCLYGINALGLHLTYSLLAIAIALLITEGFIALLRLIYHSNFWIKQFNAVSCTILSVEMLCIIGYTTTTPTSAQLLIAALTIKCFCNLILIACATAYLPTLYPTIIHTHQSTSTTYHSFIKHSGIMWFNTTLKSLSERNFMVPFLTYTLGPVSANLYKVANDAALFFHRSALKTIGTTDTSLLAHANTKEGLLPVAFTQLTRTVATLCLPLLALAALFIIINPLPNNPFIVQAFCILVIGNLLEALLSPYERILEVKQQYISLCMAYIPYIVGIIVLLTHDSVSIMGLLGCLLCIQMIRLSGSILTTYYAHKKYQFPFPLQGIGNFLLIGIPALYICFIVINHTDVGTYIQTALGYAMHEK